MTLTEVIESWVREAERMSNAAARGVVVTESLYDHLAREQRGGVPLVAGLTARVMASVTGVADDGLARSEMVEIGGPDRVSIYVGLDPEESASRSVSTRRCR